MVNERLKRWIEETALAEGIGVCQKVQNGRFQFTRPFLSSEISEMLKDIKWFYRQLGLEL